ncbi:MAG: hypothetical protein ACRDQA_07400 [Nocardioidaceae bacterium]
MTTTSPRIRRWAATIALVVSMSAAFLLTGCSGSPSSDPTPGPTTDSHTATAWMPPDISTTQVSVADRQDQQRATVTVGELVRFDGPKSVDMRVEPQSLRRVTFYGDRDSLLALQPGTVQITFPNHNKHFDCDDGGACAYQNQPFQMTLTIEPGGTAPAIPNADHLDPATPSVTVHLTPGQALTVPESVQDVVPGQHNDATTTYEHTILALCPGTTQYTLLLGDHESADVNPGLTVVVDKPRLLPQRAR